jgi:N6-adenosine-specific RNA methylase IME4
MGRQRLYIDRSDRDRVYYQRKKQGLVSLKAEGTSPTFSLLPPGPYRVIYADPPWQYKNDSYEYYGHAACKYPTLSIEALCQLPVKAIAAKNAVLFLWVTSPLLLEAAPVVKAWGFSYKTSIVWDKERPNFGYYVGVQHEFLWICTRGVCRPNISMLPSSVRRIPSVKRIPRTQHSAKPDDFRQLIDMLYTEGKRLELFARSETDGWDSWGNDVMREGVDGNGDDRKDSSTN